MSALPSLLAALGADDLRAIAESLAAGRLRPPFTALGLSRVCLAAAPEVVAAAMQALADDGLRPDHLAQFLSALADARTTAHDADRVDLVWSGPEAPGTASRDTAAVLMELFAEAEREILIAGYAVYHGREVFRSLAARMDADPALQVTMLLDIRRGPGDTSLASEIVKRFTAEFRSRHWPGTRLPAIYYDPRALETDRARHAALHAKCAVVDRRIALVTSANFTPAAQTKNIEVGALIRSPRFAAHLAEHFDALIRCGSLLKA
jgi:phosphatidylserine/phosphatidylglycerophosphate/cardiolipin synthase-like enzyme